MPPATVPEPPEEALCSEAAAAIELASPLAAATRAICSAADCCAPPPADCVVTSISRISSTVPNWLTVRTRYRCEPSSSRPPETLTFSALRRLMTVSMGRLSCASFCWSMSTWTSSSRPPPTFTAATPSTGSSFFLRSSSA